MPIIELKDKTKIGDHQKPYFVAELNTSHFGNVDTAKQMIEEAKRIGCDCVKFQSWSTETLYSNSFYKNNPIAKRFVKKFSLSKDDLILLSSFCKEQDIAFSSTPYSTQEVDFLVDHVNANFIKIASMDLNNYPFLSYIGKRGFPIILSTGMGDIEEITKAVNVINNEGNNNICILHCVSLYPTEMRNIRLKNIIGLKEKFELYPVGFSDHSLGTEIPIAAISLGACLIEKHFTLDKSKIGMDNQMALEPNEMKQLITNCLNVYNALGDESRVVSDIELKQREKMRRSIVANKSLKKGSVISISDIDFKRPGNGFAPSQIREIEGKVLSQDIECDTLITQDHINGKL